MVADRIVAVEGQEAAAGTVGLTESHADRLSPEMGQQ